MTPKAKWIKCIAEWDVIDWFSSRSNYWLLCKSKNELVLEHPNYACEQVKKAIEVIMITKK